MSMLSKIVIPLFVVLVIFYGFYKKINVYDAFLEGAKEGLNITLSIFPAIIAMVFAINIFLDSNFIYFLLNSIRGFLDALNIPLEIMPMALLRPVSGTASLAIMNDIFLRFGPDSFLGRLASILQGCTDTTIYVLALYYSSIGIKKIRYSLAVGLFADLVGIIMAFILTMILFN